jgi:hypothetical protein
MTCSSFLSCSGSPRPKSSSYSAFSNPFGRVCLLKTAVSRSHPTVSKSRVGMTSSRAPTSSSDDGVLAALRISLHSVTSSMTSSCRPGLWPSSPLALLSTNPAPCRKLSRAAALYLAPMSQMSGQATPEILTCAHSWVLYKPPKGIGSAYEDTYLRSRTVQYISPRSSVWSIPS